MGTAAPGTRVLLIVACLVAATVVWAQQARAGVDCTFEADPESFQLRGGEVTVTGSFTELPPNHDFYVVMATDFGPFGPEGQVLQPVGTTNGASQFDHTVTIPPDHPTGNFELTVVTSESQGLGFPILHVCSQPYTVSQVLIVGPIVLTTTTTTLGLAQPTTTSPPPTTTTVPMTTTTVPTTTTAAETTTTVAETTTTVAATTTVAETTTTTADESEALVAGDQAGGAPGWMIVLLIVMALALAAIGGYAIARRRAGGA